MPKTGEKFEDKIMELESIVKDLENGDVALDDAIDKYTKAMKLANSLSLEIKKAEDLVSKILTEENILEDFNIEDNN